MKRLKTTSIKAAEDIPNFGAIDWYIRLSNDVKWKKVGISRKIGMLITRKARFLEQFTSFKYFDMFVCVRGKEGNEILNKLENPQHTEFELNRINDLPKEEKITRGYKRFTTTVKRS